MKRDADDAFDSPRLASGVGQSTVATRGKTQKPKKRQVESRSSPAGQRTIRPFRPLPSGRAVVGGLLITLAALGSFVLTGRDVEDMREPYYVAATALSPGHEITPEDLRPELLDLPPGLAATSVLVDAEADLLGAVVLGPIGAGELLQRSGVTPPGKAGEIETAVEFSFSLPEGRAPRSLRPGEHVAMLSTVGRDRDAVTTVVVAEAVVTDFSFDDEGFGSSGDVIVTLAISGSDDVLAAVNAAQATDVTILRIPADGSLTLPQSSAPVENDGFADLATPGERSVSEGDTAADSGQHNAD